METQRTGLVYLVLVFALIYYILSFQRMYILLQVSVTNHYRHSNLKVLCVLSVFDLLQCFYS